MRAEELQKTDIINIISNIRRHTVSPPQQEINLTGSRTDSTPISLSIPSSNGAVTGHI